VTAGYTVGARTVVMATRYTNGTDAFVLEYDGLGWANLKAPVVTSGS
jgi:hypothetical protein